MRRFIGLGAVVFLTVSIAVIAQGDTPRRAFKAILRNPEVVQATRRDVSPPIRTVTKGLLPGAARVTKQVTTNLQTPPPLVSFNGMSNQLGFYPPDTNGDVGMNQYVQMVNSQWAVYSKDGQRLFGPARISSLWQGFGGPCEETDHGDPIVQYDTMANRWVISQFSLPDFPNPPFYECIAVSTSEDATGSYNRYEFLMSNQNLPDYPHFGVWPDGYYMSVNLFKAPSFEAGGQGIVAFDREAMLNGDPAEMIKFSNPDFFGALPADLTGSTPPPSGAPNYLVVTQDTQAGGPADQLVLYEFHTDWTNPDASEITGPALVKSGKMNTILCNGFSGCIPQKGTRNRLDSISGFPDGGVFMMYPLAYRNHGTHESLVLNHTFNAGSNRAGIRWYELREPGANVSLFQRGAHAPSGSKHRWMGSISMDGAGNIALGYSLSGGNTHPSIAYTGRLATDPLGQMTQGETIAHKGGGAQKGATRWGDYSSMMVDPVDDCTFWYTTEYYSRSAQTNWKTRIISFRLPGCPTNGPPTPSP